MTKNHIRNYPQERSNLAKIIAEFQKDTFDWLKPADIDSVNLLSVIQD